MRARQAFANVRRVNPVLALGLLAAAGLLATRLPPLTSRPSLHLDLAIAAGVPLVLVGLVLGPGIEFIGRPLLRALAPVSAFAIGWIGALLGARFEWRYVRRIPRAAWLLGATTATAVVVVVALGAWLLARLVPPLATVWTPRLPAVLGLAAVAAVSGPRAVTAVARAVGLRKSASRALERAAALETACGAVVMIVPLALHRSQLGAGNPELGWVSWIVFAAGSGVLVGLVFLSVTRLRAAREEAGLALAACMLFGAGIGYATDLSPFVVCALAAVLIVNASPRRRQMQTALAEWERPICAVFLIIAGALLTLPTVWILAAVPVLAALRVGARWASARYARVALRLRDVPSHIGLGTVAQGGTALALGINYFLMYGDRPDTPGGGIAGDAAGAVLTTLVLGIALAQLAAPTLMRLASRAVPAPLTPATISPELTTNARAD
ncbi:MAG: hypothetical protein AUH78_18300 [Gemmatimonadetes bacterium 13_1_40CM_4_69_8]|nr:MAG: hypothetical protein AUH78_18300 [Gemmatimonadetes bacterium 13_1_40CM_4_69_8]